MIPSRGRPISTNLALPINGGNVLTVVCGAYGAISVTEGENDLPTPVRPSPVDRGAVGPGVGRSIGTCSVPRTIIDCHTLHVLNHVHARIEATV